MGVSSVSVTALPHHYSSQWDQMIRDGHGPGKQTTYLLFSFPPPLLFFHSRPVSSFTPRYTLYHYGSILLRSIHLRWCFPLSPITMAAAAEASYWSLYDIPREVEGERVWSETNVQREERMNSAQCHWLNSVSQICRQKKARTRHVPAENMAPLSSDSLPLGQHLQLETLLIPTGAPHSMAPGLLSLQEVKHLLFGGFRRPNPPTDQIIRPTQWSCSYSLRLPS